MTVRYCGHHCTQLRLGIFNPVGRDGSPPTLIRVVPRTERAIHGGVLVSVTVCGLGGQEIKSLDLSHLWVFSKGFFSGRTFTQGLKINGEKHAGNL